MLHRLLQLCISTGHLAVKTSAYATAVEQIRHQKDARCTITPHSIETLGVASFIPGLHYFTKDVARLAQETLETFTQLFSKKANSQTTSTVI